MLAVALCGDTYAQDPGTNALRECIAVGLKARIPAQQYRQMLVRIASLPCAEETWFKEYGRNNLSSFVVYNQPFERRVFAIDYLTTPQEIARKLFNDANQSRHVCEESDIGTISITYSGKDGTVISGLVTVERPSVYRVHCCFVATKKQSTGNWCLEFIGVANRLSPEIRLSRPVFVRRDIWDDIDLKLRDLGIPLSLATEQSPAD